MLLPSTREWLMENNGDAVPPEIVADIARVHGPTGPRAHGPTATDSESEHSGVYLLSDEEADWIETVANKEEPR
ncbi:MAG: hypothetical protein LH475_01815 [Cryobacterium sp.]|uniref:hypothetical protein n=1 Tax=Cryobacterium sp. TaxID=1926290 RepID=UPI00228EFAB2|nr:hypothetical protein [Cryobacterium sp.]MCY7403367.1 hypothetical protein [Cryobacterium sp.]